MRGLLLAAMVSIGLFGCAAGQTTNYHDGALQLASFAHDKSDTLFVGVSDKRPYVLSGNKRPDFTGLVRSLYGIPYSRYTATGNPLSVDLTGLFTRSLESQGYNVESLELGLRADVASVIRDSLVPGSLAFVYQLKEWKTDSMHREVFIYDVTLDVFADSGNVLASVSETGRRRIGRNFHFSAAIMELLDKIHNDPVITSALAQN